jgi:hypothetical protein
MSNQRSQRFIRFSLLAAFLVLLPIVGAPAEASHDPPPPEEPAAEEEETCPRFKEFDPANFPSTPNIDNIWFPLIPGTQLVLEGEADRGSGIQDHRVIFSVTGLTKMIAGVATRVMWDLDISQGRLSEAELAFFAQETDGTVWSLGEYPEEYEEEIFVTAESTWIHGASDAEGGIHMQGQPEVSDVEYLQGEVPSIEFLDCAKVVSMSESVCVPVGCISPALLTHEGGPGVDPAAEDGVQTKYHAQGVGIVKVGFINDPEGEILELVQRNQFSPEALALVNREALRLEKRAYRTGFGSYSESQPITPPRDAPTTLRRFRGAEAQPRVARPRDGDALKGGKARWCVRALGRRLCKRWATTGSVLPA